MPGDADTMMLYVALGLLLAVNTLGVALVALQLPGTWVILGATTLVAWWRWDAHLIGLWTLVALAAIAVAGELLEFVTGAAAARRAGGTRCGAVGALAGGIVGALLGTAIPVPVVGTLIGACLGAGAGSALADRSGGRTWEEALRAGRGAAAGRFAGTVLKLIVACVMWIVAAVAVFV